MIYSCCDENRRAAVLANTTTSGVNGIDYLEVLDHESPVSSLRQRTLLIYCLKPVQTDLTSKNVLIVGGESVTGITAQWIAPATPVPAQITAEAAAFSASGDTADATADTTFFANLAAQSNADQILVVRVSQYGDFSRYTFRLVNDAAAAAQDSFDIPEALSTFDPQLAEICFSFKVECGPEFDCNPVAPDCPPDLPTPPPINYLAKDYSSFRQVMLDRLNQLLPSWNASSEADIGVMLAELVSYAGDQLSYRQDAITTEAYLLTARSRISLRRHALLVDYRVHEGCNARVWMQVTVSTAAGVAVFLDRKKTRFYTFAPGMPTTLAVGADTEQAALIAGVVVFEPMQNANLFSELNLIYFYTWGDRNCCLPQGSTEATLKGAYANLQVGDVLIFQEVMGPQTGFPADADIRHRCAVRLTAVTTQTAAGQPLTDPLFDINGAMITTLGQTAQSVTEIQWSSDDALPFPVCISSQYVDSTGKTQSLINVSVVLGNIVLADQGLSIPKTALGTVPGPSLYIPPNPAANRCSPTPRQALPVRFRPPLAQSPITQAVPLPLAGSPSTSSAVPLKSTGFVSLSDSNGFTTLMVAPVDPAAWPQYFGVVANVNSIDPTQVDLTVVYAPPGGATGVGASVTLERFVGLSFTTTDTNYIATVLGSSQFLSVPSAYTPPATPPAGYPTAITYLPNSGTILLLDSTSTAYLELATTPPTAWPANFGVVAQGQLNKPDIFNLLLLYSPQSGSQGVTLPVILEQFNNLSLKNIASQITSAAQLITVKTFEEGPSPSLSASDLMSFDASEAVPVIRLKGVLDGVTTKWTVAPDLLGDGPDDTQFVVEIDTDGTAYLRFGDGTNGKTPEATTVFSARYRIGNGTAGNVGANSLLQFAADTAVLSSISACTNPLSASGGIDPETNAQICRRAPQAFMTQERAITMQDYVNVTEQNPQIEDAAAVARWTGSWYTIFITAEPLGNANLTKPVLRSLYKTVNSYRLAGQDIYIEPPQYVSLKIVLAICVDPGYFRLDVEKALLQALGSGTLANGQPAYFAAQNFELGQTVYLSPIYEAARAVTGVQTVVAKVFEPQGQNTSVYLNQGYIPMNAFQVARLANDPSLPNHGQLKFKMQGGR
jgi:hypothetical protein